MVGAVIVNSLVRPTRVLAARRRDVALASGQWEFPGGKVETGETPEGGETEPGGEGEGDEVTDDVPLAPPGGPVALYRAEIGGAFTKGPKLITRDVAGAAVWIPGPLPPTPEN